MTVPDASPKPSATTAVGLFLMGLLLVGLLWLSTAAAAVVPERGSELDRWVDGELSTWLRSRLTEHPRLRGEPLVVVAAQGAVADPTPDGLAAGLSERLRRLVLDTPGAVLAREPAPPDWQQPVPPRLDCRPGTARYLLAVEVTAAGGTSRVELRVLDLDDNAWVSGFARSWNGRLTRSERAAAATETAAEGERGRRGLPFEPVQPDLLAGRLAHTLGCGLLSRPEEDLTVWLEPTPDAGGYGTAVGLVGQYLARAGLLRAAPSRDDADLVLSGRLHAVDGPLKQLWVSLQPPADAGFAGVEATAYVRDSGSLSTRQPVDVAAPAVSVAASVAVDDAPNGPALADLRVLRLTRPCRPGDCDERGRAVDPALPLPAGAPLALEATSDIDARVFLLELVPGGGLRRLAPGDCRLESAGLASGVALGPGTRLRHPLDEAAPELTVFAVALRPGGADRRLAELLGDVPSGCGVQPLQGGRLSRWLSRFDAALRGRDLAWQALRLSFNPGSVESRADEALLARD